MAEKSYEKRVGVERKEEFMVPSSQAKEVKAVPDFFTYMEEEFNGDYSAARSAYIMEYGVDPTMMALR